MIVPADRLTRAIPALLLPLALLCLPTACAAPAMSSTVSTPLTVAQLAQLWMEPTDLASRDLFAGAGGSRPAPDPNATYKVTAVDLTGYSGGYDVVDPSGREWKVKLGNEVQSEIVSSRVLWAIGFHQPPTYFVGRLTLDGGRPDDNGRASRFRAEDGYKTESDWSWHENPYVGTRPFRGLLVANLMLNNWDLKPSQNRIYVMSEPSALPLRRYVVQDLGASLGRTKWPTGDRNNIVSFESQNLVDRVEGNVVKFDYHGRHTELFKDITPGDVVWTSRLLAGLSDTQWNDAFRAANYPAAISQRYIAKMKSKIQEGLALEKRAAITR